MTFIEWIWTVGSVTVGRVAIVGIVAGATMVTVALVVAWRDRRTTRAAVGRQLERLDELELRRLVDRKRHLDWEAL